MPRVPIYKALPYVNFSDLMIKCSRKQIESHFLLF
jgi:hypothetical protein